MTAKQVFFNGRVQGVGFRWTVKQIAKGFDVTGWVKNLADGRVELCVAGEADEIAAFTKAISESELRAHIKEVQEHPIAQAPRVQGFQILHD
ncbi:MAG TPA: acylphosphatase [Chthoniobacterales bacterium]|jgi:acylphosphatase